MHDEGVEGRSLRMVVRATRALLLGRGWDRRIRGGPPVGVSEKTLAIDSRRLVGRKHVEGSPHGLYREVRLCHGHEHARE